MINCNPNGKNQNRNPEQKVSIHGRYTPSVNNTDWVFIIYNKKAAGFACRFQQNNLFNLLISRVLLRTYIGIYIYFDLRDRKNSHKIGRRDHNQLRRILSSYFIDRSVDALQIKEPVTFKSQFFSSLC